MWDVNHFAIEDEEAQETRFILTMWDVNLTGEIMVDGEGKFYINYVGCKLFGSFCFNSSTNLFYINYVGCKSDLHLLRLVYSHWFYINYVGCKWE